ncbi:MAG: hypothetical protein ACE5DX_00495 [Candidatus Dojkabacteria bacterium]
MKKLSKYSLILLVVSAPLLLILGTVSAQTSDVGKEFGNRVQEEGNFRPGMRKFGRKHPGAAKEHLSEFFGMTEEELMQARKDGKTIEDLLEEQGKTKDDLREFAQEQFAEHLQEKIDSGELDAEKLDTMIDRMQEQQDRLGDRIDQLQQIRDQISE